MAISEKDYEYLSRAVELAEEAVDDGDGAFGTILVSADGEILFEDRNRDNTVNVLSHPEYTAAAWALENLDPEERKQAVVYTSGEHCPMCSAAHGWAGLGRIVYVMSSRQLAELNKKHGLPAGPIKPVPVQDVLHDCVVDGPADKLVDKVAELQLRSAK